MESEDPVTLGAIAIGLSAIGTGVSILTRPSAPKPATLPAAQDPLKAAYAEAQAIAKRRGAASTILTGPEGITGPPTTLKTQLGA